MIKMESISKRKDGLIINWYDLLFIISGFLLARVSILNKLTPFGLAYLGASLLMNRANFWLPISVVLGLFSIHGLSGTNYYLSSLIIYMVLIKKSKDRETTVIKGSFLVSGIFFLSQFIWNIKGNNLKYDLFVLVFESLIIFTMAYIFSYSLPIDKLKLQNIKGEQLVASLITIALVLSGFNNISFYNIGLKNIISMAFIIYIAYRQGILLGVGVAVVLGIVSYISHIEMPFIISILAAGGLLAGLFRDLGKMGSIAGFVLGSGIISFYINNYGTSFLSYQELIVGSLAFLIIERFLKLDIESYLDANKKIKEKYKREREGFILKKLDKNIELLDDLSQIFRKSIEEEKIYVADNIYSLVDQVSNKSCSSCDKYEECWEENYYDSYQNIYKLISLMEGKSDKNDLDLSKLLQSCLDAEDLVNKTRKFYNSFKERQFYNVKLMEQRKLIADQIQGLGNIIKDIKKDISLEPIFHRDLEEEIAKELKNKRVDVIELTVVEIEENKLDILMEIGTSTYSRQEIDEVGAIVSQLLDMSFSIDYSYGDIGENSRSFKLTKTNRYNTFTRTSYESNSEDLISGDNHTFGEIGNTSFLAISDGMGIGKKANEESNITIELIEKMMEVNMDKNTIIKTINSVLRSKSDDEIFTTLDLGLIDLYTGKLQILKNGSPPTFIKRKDEVKIINSRSLPLGILENVDMNIYEEDLEDGDIIIMMSDGVLESNKKVEDMEEWMRNIILKIPSQNPQTISDEILSVAKFVEADSHRDDMTIIATKIWKNI